MNTSHSHFEVLCALAGSGQLTDTEMVELREHSEHCLSCSSRLVEINQLSLHIFCAHALRQPVTGVPKGLQERFIARANNEGVPLDSHTPTLAIGGSSWAAAFVGLMLLVFSVQHSGPSHNPADTRTQANQTGVSKSLFKENGNSPDVSENGSASRVRAGQTRVQPVTKQRLHGAFLSVSRTTKLAKSSQIEQDGSQHSQFDPTAYSRTFTMFSRSFLGIARSDDKVQWSPAQHLLPKLDFVGPLDLMNDDPPRLLAECEHRTFALWNPQGNFGPGVLDAQALRRDFDPDTFRTPFTRDFKENIPALQFTQKATH
jgi:hypothetical protein